MAGGLGVLGVLLLGPYVASGSFAWDDWENAATTAHPPADGFLGPVDLGLMRYRPLLALLLPLPHLLFGARPELHLALAALLAVLASLTFHVVLRALGLPALVAGGAAVLALLFPFSDSTRLWATASINLVALVLAGLGLLLALRGLATPDPGWRRRLHAASVTAYAASLLTYEAAAVLILLTGLLHARRVGRQAAWRWWRLDAAVLVPILGAEAALTSHPERSLPSTVAHGPVLAVHGLELVGRALIPGLTGALALALGATVVLAAALAARRATGDARTWLTWAGGGAIVAVAAWAMLLPAAGPYDPLSAGVFNRGNILAAFGFALAAAAGVRALWATRARWAAPALAALVAGGWAGGLERDVGEWKRAARESTRELAVVRRTLARAEPRTLLVVSRQRFAGAGVPVFAAAWDLNSAVKLRAPGRAATVLARARELRCRRGGVAPRPALNNVVEPVPYGQAALLDADSGALVTLADPAACRSARESGASGRAGGDPAARTGRRGERPG